MSTALSPHMASMASVQCSPFACSSRNLIIFANTSIVKMKVSFLVNLINWLGSAFVLLGAIGLVLDVFDFAFRFVHHQLVWRAFLHILFIPMGTAVATLTYTGDEISSQSYSMLVGCAVALVIGCLGLTIGSYELAVVKVDTLFFQRTGIYSLCVVLGFLCIPMQSNNKIKVV